MTDKTTALQEMEKQELETTGEAEPTRARKIFVPRVDIYETGDEVVVLADMPGVDDKSVDITLEKNVLTINGYVEMPQPDNFDLTYAEYSIGDYRRSFTLSDEVDRDNIEATVKDGVLRLRLPKAGPARARKIAVKAG